MGFDEFREEAGPEAGTAANPYAAPRTITGAESSSPSESESRSLLHPRIGWAVLWVFAFWGFQLVISAIVGIAMIVWALSQGSTSPDQLADVTLMTMIPLGTFSSVVFAAIVASIVYRGAIMDRLALRGLSLTQWVVTVLVVLPMAILASEVTNCAGEVLPDINTDVLEGFADGPLLLVLLAGGLFPALGEEIFCRGFLGRGLVANHGVVRGVFFASLLFGILHVDPVQSIGAFTLGIGLHFAYLTTRSLIAPVAIHFLNNVFAFILVRNYETYPLPGLSPLPDGTAVHTPLPVLLLAAVALTCLCAVLLQSRTRWLLPDGSAWNPGYVTAEAPPPAEQARRASSVPHAALLVATPLVYTALLWTLFSAQRSALDPIL
ncbi:MAG: hypothetical protein CMJ64_04325 [Planctomycetaceae bacterium]|nr:hypothetical protein [Planctomycetaceae bacterium]